MAQRAIIRDTVCQILVTQDTDFYLQAVAVDRKLRGNSVGSALMDVDAEAIEVDEVRLDLLRHDPAT